MSIALGEITILSIPLGPREVLTESLIATKSESTKPTYIPFAAVMLESLNSMGLPYNFD